MVFDALVIDEACQATEVSTLVPLVQHKFDRLVLVGDPCQLAPTIFSPIAREFNYAQSLMERFHHAGHSVVLLDQQYRMHPLIRHFPSKKFYEG